MSHINSDSQTGKGKEEKPRLGRDKEEKEKCKLEQIKEDREFLGYYRKS